MKFLTSTLLAFFTLTAYATLDQNITLTAKNISAQDLLRELSKQANVDFKVDPNLKMGKKLSIQVKHASLQQVLNFVAEEEQISWAPSTDGSIHISATK